MSVPESPLDSRTALRGAVAGVAAFLLGYVITYAWRAPAIDDALGGINVIAELAGGQAIPTWKAVGWLYLNAHFVPTRLPTLGGGSQLVNFVRASDDGSLALLYVLVAAVLLLGGALLARLGSADRTAGAATDGAAVVVGYFPATVALALASGHTIDGDLGVAPDLLTAVVLAGVVLPVFLGTLGGALAGRLGRTTGA